MDEYRDAYINNTEKIKKFKKLILGETEFKKEESTVIILPYLFDNIFGNKLLII